MAAGPISNSTRWKSNADDWLVQEFEDTFLVFFRPSAETHFLNFLSYGVLEFVSGQPATQSEIAAELRTKFRLEAHELPDSLLAQTIEQLDETGLIEPESER